MLVMSELKHFTVTELDYRIVLRHMPDCPLYMQRKTGDRFKAIFEREYEVWAHQPGAEQAGQVDPWRARFLFCGLIYARREDLYSVDTATLVMASSNWLPLDHPYERLLIDELVRQERRFIKPLRFESRRGAAFPNAVLLDTGDSETPLDIVTPFMADRDRQAKQAAIAKREVCDAHVLAPYSKSSSASIRATNASGACACPSTSRIARATVSGCNCQCWPKVLSSPSSAPTRRTTPSMCTRRRSAPSRARCGGSPTSAQY
jgi:hypothetical protein